MKYTLAFFVLIIACQTTQKINYTTIVTPKEKTIIGYLNRAVLEQDTSFAWFANNLKYGTPDSSAIAAFAANKNKCKLLVFGGTWCEDTQILLPIFYKLIDRSRFPTNKITLVGVNRSKSSIDSLPRTYNIKHIPVFIVLDNKGKEIGRVTEFGTLNAIDKELGQIVASITP
jgi:thiol-disulfide isomerase/thioredoxin